MSAWPDWLKAIQLSPRFLFGLLALGVLVLWMPDRWTDSLGFTAIRTEYRDFIGIGTLAALVFWVVQLLPIILRRLNRAKTRRQILTALDCLSGQERLLLAYCFSRGQKTVTLSMIDGVARALTAKGLLVPALGTGSVLAWPYTVPDFVWDYLCESQDRVFGENMPSAQEQTEYFQQLDDYISRYCHR